jgi:hypothetical protein
VSETKEHFSSSAFAPFQFTLSKSQHSHTAFVHITADVPIVVPSNTRRLVVASWMSLDSCFAIQNNILTSYSLSVHIFLTNSYGANDY